jgi:aminoglycoside phosphotransferase (APT) family kinase protein
MFSRGAVVDPVPRRPPDGKVAMDHVNAAADPVALTRYLAQTGVPLAGSITTRLVGGGKSNLTFRVTDGWHHWVLRRPPLGSYHPGAHDVAREHTVMAALAETAVPVPTMVLRCDDATVIGAPFYLMKHVDGTVLRTREQVAGLSPVVRRELSRSMINTLADLHQLDYDKVGLSGLGRPMGYLERQLDRWHRQYHSVADRAAAQVDVIAETLNRGMPQSPQTSVVHGDYRIDNVIVGPSNHAHIAAVLDWEMATLGDPLADLATFVMFWDEPGRPFNPITAGLTAFDGFRSKAEVIESYATRRALPEQMLDSLDWYLAFAKFKLAVILEQIHVRHMAGQTPEKGFEGVASMVDELLDDCSSSLILPTS